MGVRASSEYNHNKGEISTKTKETEVRECRKQKEHISRQTSLNFTQKTPISNMKENIYIYNNFASKICKPKRQTPSC